MTISAIICGALGRMGRACVELGITDPNFVINAALVRPGAHYSKPTHWSCEITDNLYNISTKSKNIIIDFSHSSQLITYCQFAQQHRFPLLIGTTGHSADNFAAMHEVAKSIPVLYAPNTSLMANLLILLSSHISKTPLKNLDIYIQDIHHKHKKDAPSGTALAIQKALNKYQQQNIIINSQRCADVVGEHTVTFFKENERLELSHKVNDRRIFAEGALVAAEFLFAQGPGLYDMSDVLNLK
jgi:4-hydroxy-tetrahydrodipicolinate reductase